MPSLNPAKNYFDYRPRYPQRLIDDLRERTTEGHRECLVDWGCGTGELTLRLSAFFDRVTAVDHHAPMIEVARENARRANAENIEWVVGRAEDLNLEPESCDLITSASAFHWMDRELLVHRATRCLKSGSALALIGGAGGGGIFRMNADWHRAAASCVERHTGAVSSGGKAAKAGARAGQKSDTRRQHADFLTPAGFQAERIDYSVDYYWEVDQIIGYLYSVGFVSLGTLGDRREAFEHDLRLSLEEVNPSGVFKQALDFYLIVARQV